MPFISLATGLAAALLANTASASITAMNLNETGSAPNRAKVVNNCGYPVYLWSVLKGQGCPADDAVVLNTGEFYHEKFRLPENDIGVSIKISKSKKCKDVDITQLEYFLETRKAGFNYNYLDVSYVDCNIKGDCPGRSDGYYLKSGNTDRITVADASNSICPTFQCDSTESCDKTSYVEWDDVQTKSCDLDAPLDFYLCGQTPQGGSSDNDNSEKPAPSSSEEEKPEETPAPTKVPDVQKANVVEAAEVTPAPQPSIPNVKTEVVYVTKFEYVHAKRHAHNHVHKHFRA